MGVGHAAPVRRHLGFGDWSWNTPVGMVYACSFRASDGATAGFLVPADEYNVNPGRLILDKYPRWDPSYATFATLFAAHKTINHSVAYSKPGGISNNLAESLNARMRRGTEGIYLNQSGKYTHDYSVEQAWRSDYRRTPTGKRLMSLFRHALFVGPSMWWRGFWQGEHRQHELLLEGNEPAKGRGKEKDWTPRRPR